MADIICVIGNKGGTGKTTLSHMLCQGLGLLGQRAACVLTDTSREPLIPTGRRYVLADARTRAAPRTGHCEPLRAMLADIWTCGNALADALAQRYFTHLDARSRATASL